MARFRKLLIALDDSESSAHALRESLRFARGDGSRVLAVAVVPPYAGDLRLVGVRSIKAVLREPCEKALAGARQVADGEVGTSLWTACLEGEPHEEIVNLAEAEGCDLIVMGRGADALDRFVMGSVTARVVGYSERDVLVVPQGTAIGWRELLLATDGSNYSERAAERAVDIARSYGGHLSIVAATDLACELYAESPEVGEDLIEKARGTVEEGRKRADSSGVAVECHVREGLAYKAIIDLAKEKKIEAIIMGSHGRTGLRRLLMGSVVEKVIGHAPCPVLVVKR
ncbi:MAG TPA: universal stress protein [Syntrophobacteria bacterium]|nr:universal stress protein [Syntrophobacteria bacterium]